MVVFGPPLDEPIDVVDVVGAAGDANPDEVALVSPETCLTWRELDDASTRLAGSLLGMSLAPGARVASLMPNVPSVIVHYVACAKAGLVATPLNYRYTEREIDFALGASGADALVAHTERRYDVAKSAEATRLAVGVVWSGAGAPAGAPILEELWEGDGERTALPTVERSEPAFLFFTSGSTGAPKGVVHTHDSMGWIAASTRAALAYQPGDRFMSGSSLSHEGGVGFSFAALGAGIPIVVPRTVSPDDVLPLLRLHRPTVAWTLPPLLSAWIRHPDATSDDFHSLRMCMTGGDQAPAVLRREFEHLAGFALHETYGTTESGCITINPRHGVNKSGSIGPLGPGYTAEIRDETGRPLPADVPGSLWVTSSTTTTGYWDDADATARAFDGAGWIDTGDVMSVDTDCYLWFHGRTTQIIVHDGSNVSPQEIEGVLLEHPAVESAAVVGVPDVLHGENVRAYVVVRDDAARTTTDELIAFARQRVGYKAPAEIIFIDALPLTPAGKVDRRALSRDAAGGSEAREE